MTFGRSAHRLALATTAGVGRRLWVVAYAVASRLIVRRLTRGIPGAEPTVVRGVGRTDFVPLVSDLDLRVVVADTADALRVHGRYDRLVGRLPFVRHVADPPVVLTRAEHELVVRSSCLTYGLDVSPAAAAYGDDGRLLDRLVPLERPQLGSSLGGRRDRAQDLAAGWLNLLWTWRVAFAACADPTRPHVPLAAVKLVTDPLRILLWLEQDVLTRDRRETLERGRRLLGDEEDALTAATLTLAALPRSPEPPLAQTLPFLVRASARIAELIARETAAAGSTAVPLTGVAAMAGEQPRPAADWRSLVCPRQTEPSLVLLGGDASDPRCLGKAAAAQHGDVYGVSRVDGLLLLPSVPYERTRMRAVSCATTEPVLHAVAAGAAEASFPAVTGWSIADVARRAVAEHRAALEGDLRTLLRAARAALLYEGVQAGSPLLPVTPEATAELLGERVPSARTLCDVVVGELAEARPAVPATVQALRSVVARLPALG